MTDARDAAGIVVETDVMVRMRDGVHLACDVYRPASGGPVPALVQRQPYDKRVAQTYVYDHPAVYARHGYAVVIEDTRGRHASEGDFYPLRLDAEDGYDTIEWCAAQPWCNGRVGSFGFSIPGVNQLLAAALHPPHLAAAVPGFYPGGMYEGFTHVGGTFGLAAVMDWGLIIAGEAAQRRGDKEVLSAIGAAQAVGGRWPAALSLRDIPFLETPDLLPFLARTMWTIRPTAPIGRNRLCTWLRFAQGGDGVGKGFCMIESQRWRGGRATSSGGFCSRRIEAERDELIEIRLQMLATQPDKGRTPRAHPLRFSEDLVDPRQDEVSGGLPDDIGTLWRSAGDRSVAGPLVGFRDGGDRRRFRRSVRGRTALARRGRRPWPAAGGLGCFRPMTFRWRPAMSINAAGWSLALDR